MKKILVLGVLISIYSCTPKTETVSEVSFDTTSTPTVEVENEDNVQEERTITTHINFDDYKVYELGDSIIEFESGRKFGEFDSLEAIALSGQSNVSRVDGELKFTLGNGEPKIYTNNTETDGDDYAHYVYLKDMNEIGHWLVFASYYESLSYILIDQETGEEIYLWGYPVLSPDNKFMLTSMEDLSAGYVNNGFELYNVENKMPDLMWQISLDDWGSENIIWTKDNYIFAEQRYRDPASSEILERVIRLKFAEE
jgi:hypothetical protein